MHEQSLINSLINKILTLATEEQATAVTKVSVKLGALSHMSADHFKEHFDIAARGTIAENAILESEECQDIYDKDAQVIILKSIDVT